LACTGEALSRPRAIGHKGSRRNRSLYKFTKCLSDLTAAEVAKCGRGTFLWEYDSLACVRAGFEPRGVAGFGTRFQSWEGQVPFCSGGGAGVAGAWWVRVGVLDYMSKLECVSPPAVSTFQLQSGVIVSQQEPGWEWAADWRIQALQLRFGADWRTKALQLSS